MYGSANELTQRLMNLNETGEALFGGGRVAGEKGKEYVLVRNEGVEGGYALGVISEEGAKEETAIDLDEPAPNTGEGDAEEEEEVDEFEDVPIAGLNRLPKRPRPDSDGQEDVYAKRRRNSTSRENRRAANLKSGSTMILTPSLLHGIQMRMRTRTFDVLSHCRWRNTSRRRNHRQTTPTMTRWTSSIRRRYQRLDRCPKEADERLPVL